jgi:hypothetical protein
MLAPEVRAVRLLAGDVAVAVAPEDQLGAEEALVEHLAGRHLVGHGDLEPAEGHRKREPAHHYLRSPKPTAARSDVLLVVT